MYNHENDLAKRDYNDDTSTIQFKIMCGLYDKYYQFQIFIRYKNIKNGNGMICKSTMETCKSVLRFIFQLFAKMSNTYIRGFEKYFRFVFSLVQIKAKSF